MLRTSNGKKRPKYAGSNTGEHSMSILEKSTSSLCLIWP